MYTLLTIIFIVAMFAVAILFYSLISYILKMEKALKDQEGIIEDYNRILNS